MTISLLSQSVTIDAVPVRVSDLSISDVLSQTLKMDFIVDVDANPGLVPALGQSVTVTQTCDGVQTYSGVIWDVKFQRGSNYNRYRVSVRGVSSGFSTTRFVAVYGRQGMSQFLNSVFSTYAPTVPLSIDPGAPEIEEFSSVYGSVADVVNYSTNSSQWAWRAASGVFEFFDPTANVQSDVVQSDFERGSLEVRQSLDGVYNIGHMQSYRYIWVDFSRIPLIAGVSNDYCFTDVGLRVPAMSAPDGVALKEWEFLEFELVRASRADDGDPSEVSFTFDPEKTMMQSSVQLNNREGVFVRARFRRLVWAEVRHENSIALFGEREAPPFSDDNGTTVNEALRFLSEYLELRAYPDVSLSGILLRSDVMPGERRRVELPSFGIDTELIFDGVTRTTRKTELTVKVSASSLTNYDVITPGGPVATGTKAQPKGQVLPEVFHRLERLENARMSPLGRNGVISQSVGPVQSSAEFSADMVWTGEFETGPLPVGGFSLGHDFVVG